MDEHPVESHGPILMACTLEGFTRFQSVWHAVGGMRMVSKRENDPQAAPQIKNWSLADTLPDLKIASKRLKSLISDISHYPDLVGLDVSYGFMTPRTAEGVFKTLSNCLHY